MVKVSFPAGEAGVRRADTAYSLESVSSCEHDHCVSSKGDPEGGAAGTGAGSRVVWGNKSAKMRAPTRRTARFSTADEDGRPRRGRGSLWALSVAMDTPVCRVLARLGFRACVSGVAAVVCSLRAPMKTTAEKGVPFL